MAEPIVDTKYHRQHDLGPVYYFKAIDKDGTAIPLTSAVATMEPAAGGADVFTSQACTITDSAAGEGYYAWQAADVATVGEFYFEIKCTPVSGAAFTLPVDGRALVIINADLDGA